MKRTEQLDFDAFSCQNDDSEADKIIVLAFSIARKGYAQLLDVVVTKILAVDVKKVMLPSALSMLAANDFLLDGALKHKSNGD